MNTRQNACTTGISATLIEMLGDGFAVAFRAYDDSQAGPPDGVAARSAQLRTNRAMALDASLIFMSSTVPPARTASARQWRM